MTPLDALGMVGQGFIATVVGVAACIAAVIAWMVFLDALEAGWRWFFDFVGRWPRVEQAIDYTIVGVVALALGGFCFVAGSYVLSVVGLA